MGTGSTASECSSEAGLCHAWREFLLNWRWAETWVWVWVFAKGTGEPSLLVIIWHQHLLWSLLRLSTLFHTHPQEWLPAVKKKNSFVFFWSCTQRYSSAAECYVFFQQSDSIWPNGINPPPPCSFFRQAARALKKLQQVCPAVHLNKTRLKGAMLPNLRVVTTLREQGSHELVK